MNLRCKLGWHAYRPVKVFASRGSWSVTGHECHRCDKREVAVSREFFYHEDVLQHAYNWLNRKPEPPLRALGLVKGGGNA